MEIGRQGCHANRHFCALLFWRNAMYTIDRLVAAGVDPERAFDIVYCFLEQDNASELERYICEIERGQRQRPEG